VFSSTALGTVDGSGGAMLVAPAGAGCARLCPPRAAMVDEVGQNEEGMHNF